MSIFLAPTLFVLVLIVLSVRLRRHIEPACPGCNHRSWRTASAAMACASCGWSASGGHVAAEPERRAA